MKRSIWTALGILGIGSFGLSGTASAGLIDLTAPDACTSLGGGVYACSNSGVENVGTGTFPSFLKSGAPSNVEQYQMYNTDANIPANSVDNQAVDSQTSAITLNSFAIVNNPEAGVTGSFFVLAFDINQNKSQEPDPFLTVEDLKIYTSASALLTGYNSGTGELGGVSALWSMLAADSIKLDYRNGNGSGSSVDMFLYVPVSLFTSPVYYPGTNYFYLYNANGSVAFPNNDGTEEWAYQRCPVGSVCYPPPPCSPTDPNCNQQVPEPGTLALLGLGLVGLGLGRRRRYS